ncbi:MAG: protein-S-isoprenylcysteine O-methyltransferase Ste14 [Bacteroidia bacterium]|jgi:protein-S-isoprenylcysteine O-methyltransferase Ste14
MSREQRTIFPPIWLLFGLVVIFCCNELFPGPRFTSIAGQVAGGVFIVAGLLLLVTANGLFSAAGTNVIPFREVTALVTTGVYRISRNPMYLGMLLVLIGVAVTVGATTALLVPPIFAGIVQLRFIQGEEKMLLAAYPQEYAAYCNQVRRWI